LTISVVASFIVPFIWAASSGGEYNFISTTWLSYVMIFLFYLLSYFITYFFNTAIISCAIYRMKGGDPDLRGGLRAAFARIREIFGWALVSATVGIFLKHVQNNSNLVGKLVAAVAGIAWSVASYLVIPIIVMERLGPIDALKE